MITVAIGPGTPIGVVARVLVAAADAAEELAATEFNGTALRANPGDTVERVLELYWFARERLDNTDAVNISLHTKVPSKWLFYDRETKDWWAWSTNDRALVWTGLRP